MDELTVEMVAWKVDAFTPYRIDLYDEKTDSVCTVCEPEHPTEIPEIYRNVVIDNLSVQDGVLVINIYI